MTEATDTNKACHWAVRTGQTICRLLLAVAFIFSGFVKAIDPLGTQYKIQDYLEAVGLSGYIPDWLTLTTSLCLSSLEFCLGIFLLFAIRRRLVSRLALLFMIVMTLITLWLAISNPVKDCGCFGDAIHLTNWQTFGKNLVLLAAAGVVAWCPTLMIRFISKRNQGIVINFSILFILIVSVWSLYDLPMFDFRPYHIGANIKKGMEIPKGAKKPQFETTFIMEKNGQRKEFTLDNYPDSTWTYIDARTIQTEEGYEPPIHDFSITDMATEEDITERVLSQKGYTFLLIAPYLEQADDSNFGEIDRISEYAQDNGYHFYCLTASGEKGINQWRDLTGAEYPFCTTDATTLKTVIRSNPGLLLLKQGTIVRKWSHNNLPSAEELSAPLEKSSLGKMPERSVPQKITGIIIGFILPLFLLTLADRLWAWVRWKKKNRDTAKEGNSNETSSTNKA